MLLIKCILPVFVNEGIKCQSISPACSEVLNINSRIPEKSLIKITELPAPLWL